MLEDNVAPETPDSRAGSSTSDLKLFLQPMRHDDFALFECTPGLPHDNCGMTVTTVVNVYMVFAESNVVERLDHGKLSRGKCQRREPGLTLRVGMSLY